MMPEAILEEFRSDGRVWLRDAIDADWLTELRALAALENAPGARAGPDSALFQAVCDAPFSQKLATIWPGMRPNRVVGFNKTVANNWALPWHQDRVIAMATKTSSEGYTKWTRKSGIWHCEPPEDVLERMLFVRVHLDDVATENGAMEIAVGSHRLGKLAKSDIKAAVKDFPHEVTEAAAGDVLVLSMLTLHRSVETTSNQERRVLRVDYAPNLAGVA